MQIVLQTIIGPETSVRIEATCWTPKEIGRLIQILTIMKDWFEQDERDRERQKPALEQNGTDIHGSIS